MLMRSIKPLSRDGDMPRGPPNVADQRPRQQHKLDKRKIHCKNPGAHHECKNKWTSHKVEDDPMRPWEVKWAPCARQAAVDHMWNAHQYDYNNRPGRKHGHNHPKNDGMSSVPGPTQPMAAAAPPPYQPSPHTQAIPPQHDQPHQPQPPPGSAYAPSMSGTFRQPRNYEEGEAWGAQARAPSQYSNRSGGGASLYGMGPPQGVPPSMRGGPQGGQGEGWLQEQAQQRMQQQQQGEMYGSRSRATSRYESEAGDTQYYDEPEMSGYEMAVPGYATSSYLGMNQQSMGAPQAYGMSVGPGEMPPPQNLTPRPRPSPAPSRAPPSNLSRQSRGTLVPPERQMTSATAMALAVARGLTAEPRPRLPSEFPVAQPTFMRPYDEPTPPLSGGGDGASGVSGSRMYPQPANYAGYPQQGPMSHYDGY